MNPTRQIYLEDAYIKEFEAKVVRNSGREIVLDETAFYPGGFGQPPDQGEVSIGPVNARVIEVRRAEPDYEEDEETGDEETVEEDFDDDEETGEDFDVGSAGIVHVLDQALPKTIRRVHAALDWPRRYRNMRYNTALALLCGVVVRDFGARPGVGRIRSTRARLDFETPSAALDDEAVRRLEELVNGVVSDGLDVGAGEKFLVEGLPELESGGLHVRNTSEVGEIEVTRYFDRGSRGVRLEFSLTENEDKKNEDKKNEDTETEGI